MKKNLLSLFLIIFLFKTGHLFEINQIDPGFIFSLFNKSLVGNSRVINLGPPANPAILNSNNNQTDIRISLQAFFEEQCALECLKNILCVQYLFQEDKLNCVISLRANFKRQTNIDSARNNKITDTIGCNLQSCSNGVYCSTEGKNSDGSCLCDSTLNDGPGCLNKITYELGEWSAWTPCSATCDDGFRMRSRECVKKYFDNEKKQTVTEPVNGLDWLCDSDNTKLSEKLQVEVCSLDKCKSYNEWSSWSGCSKICGGTRSRQRTCRLDAKNPLCDPVYLNEMEPCSALNDCRSNIIKLERTDFNPTANITKRGYLRFWNAQTNKDTRIFSFSNSLDDILNIGRVTCLEFGFNRSINTNSIQIDDLRSKYPESEYLNLINQQSVSGISCKGTEASIKDCQFSTAKLDTKIFELEVECLFNGYYSGWSAWTQCSVTCGAGARTRFRTCNDPPPSVSETNSGNGSTCAASSTGFDTCTMPRCKV